MSKQLNSQPVKKGSILGRWTVKRQLGEGGNGVVWLAVDKKSQEAAIKVFSGEKLDRYARFRDEVKAMIRNRDIEGILPILDHNLPKQLRDGPAWYSMPVGIPLRTYLSAKKPFSIVQQFILIAETLEKLHRRKVAHRDIKPQNLIFWKGRAYLADFGLVKFPGKASITRTNERLGPIWFMAPEMRRDANSADPFRADSYSLTKTLWAFLTNTFLGFDGQYAKAHANALRKQWPTESDLEESPRFLSQTPTYFDPLDHVLETATDDSPSSRPTPGQIATQLSEWMRLNTDFVARNTDQWKAQLRKIFPLGMPARCEWHDIDEIVGTLGVIGPHINVNYMLFPHHGGLELCGAKKYEGDATCLELDMDGFAIIGKPKRLMFESFGSDLPEWSYFRIELDSLEAIPRIPLSYMGYHQDVAELSPGQFVGIDRWEQHESNHHGRKTPMRPFYRYLKGSLLIVQKAGPYNMISGTTDGRHEKMDSEQFRRYVGSGVSQWRRKFRK